MRQFPPILKAAKLAPILLALLVAVFLLSAPPVSAQPGVPEYPAVFSACVGPATDSAGFVDMEGNFAQDAANCLVHYGITKGRTADRFAPNESVSRWQMALFLARAAVPAGVELPENPPADQFFDLDGLSEETQTAVNQMAALEIITGVTPTFFAPNQNVTRQAMAVFLARFLAQAQVGEGGTALDDIDPQAYDEQFADISALPISAFRAVRNLAELGITGGTTSTTFSPQASVTRAQMALFITRTLAHTNARPAGVTLQAESLTRAGGGEVDVVVSVRSAQHRPLADAAVDLFAVPEGVVAFDAVGACTNLFLESSVTDRNICQIDATDKRTDMLGNLNTPVHVGRSSTVYAWSGSLTDRFNLEETTSDSLPVEIVRQAREVLISDSLPDQAQAAQYGTGVTFTFQLVDRDGVPVSESGQLITVQVVSSDSDEIERLDRRTDDTGLVAITFSRSDPNRDLRGDTSTVQLLVTAPQNFGLRDETAVGLNNPLEWRDDPSEPTSLVLGQAVAYQVASQVDRGATNEITATLRDQYGNPLRNQRINFWSNDPMGVGGSRDDRGRRATTRANGIATLSYPRDSADSQQEIISAVFIVHDRYPSRDVIATPITHFWVQRPVANRDGTPRDYANSEVLFHDRAGRVLVFRFLGDLYFVRYKEGDHFFVDDQQVTFDRFRQVIFTRGYNRFNASLHEPDADGINVFATTAVSR